MNKMKWASCLLLIGLCGCSGAQASIQNGKDTLFTVGSTTYTKQDEYNLIKASNGGALTLQLAKNAVYDEVIGMDDDIRKAAQESYDDLASDYSDFEDQLKQMGYKDKDDYIDTVLIPEQQGNRLQTQYFKDNKKEIQKTYKPSIVTILKCDDDKTAQKAIDALKDGKELQEVYDTYTSADSSFSNEEIVCTTLNTDIPTRLINQAYKTKDTGVIDEVFTMDDGTTYSYVAIVSDKDYDKNLSKSEETISAGENFEKEMWVYYFTKYDLKIYDQTIFDYLKVNNPEYLLDYPELSEEDE